MISLIKKVSGVGIMALSLSLLMAGSAAAHVVVRPGEVKTSSFTTFSIGTPNEREVATTQIKLAIPEGLQYVTPTTKAGWTITTETTPSDKSEEVDKEHSESKITSITWSDGLILKGFRDEFSFSAKVPDSATELQWKAYQTYADGVVVAWDKTEAEQPKQEDGSPDFSTSGPFSVTKVVTETEAQIEVARAQTAAADADKAADQALYVAIAAAVLGIAGIGLTLRKK